MTTPTTSQFFEAAAGSYNSTPPTSSDLTPFLGPRGNVVQATRPGDGFHGVAFQTGDGDVIVSFEGTDLGDLQERPTFVNAQIAADREIYAGGNPALYDDAYRFTSRVLAVAAAQGISSDHVFLAGHSLGAAEAEYVAANTGLSGETFGAPGIPAADIAPGEASGLTNIVDYGDPVGNYSADPNLLGNFLASPDIVHFGSPTYVGDPSDAQALSMAGRLFGRSDVATAVSLGILGDALVNHHLLEDYAADLGIAFGSGTAGGSSGISSQQLAQVIGEIAGGGSAANASAAHDAHVPTLAKGHADRLALAEPAHHHAPGLG